jgi:hypothetical protein
MISQGTHGFIFLGINLSYLINLKEFKALVEN